LARVAAVFSIAADCEITLEANPGTVDRANFFGYRDAGINRISVGVQSFQPRLLQFLGRAHSADEAREALEVVHRAGFENFSFDLMYALPGQTLAELAADMDQALTFRSPHLSAYNLTFEEGTPFGHEYRSGRLKPLAEEEEIAMAELVEEKLGQAGLARYEISNYARPGFHSRHNTNYWRSGDYLGVGAGAHSYMNGGADGTPGRRSSNEKNPGRYMERVNACGSAVTDQEKIERTKAAGEFMFLGLRMTEGISTAAFHSRFGKTPVELFPRIAPWIDDMLMEEQSGFLRLTRKGLMVANSIFVEFI
jgi:oxygen-independent coproporphyrinogen-3 oxidase